MGRRACPTGLLALRGSWRAKVRDKEPVVDIMELKPPLFLGRREKKIFAGLSAQLVQMRVLTSLDGAALSRYTIALVRWMDAEKKLAAGEPTHHEIKNADGEVINCKAGISYTIVCKSHEQLLKLENEFGLTPASRPRLQVSGKSEGVEERMARAIE